MTALRLGTAQERPLQASKWLDCQALLDADEMAMLFDSLGTFRLFRTGAVCDEAEGEVPTQKFLEDYGAYVALLKEGQEPEATRYRSLFSPAMTVTLDALFAVPVAGNRRIIRAAKPVVQLQGHSMNYSQEDGKFHPMVFGSESITWGIQFSYPQLYLDSATQEVHAVKDTPAFPNTPLFHQLQRWMRQHTVPTPFTVEGKAINVPMRLGKQCLGWIHSHPHLKAKGISVRC